MKDLRIIDFGLGLPAALVAKQLAEFGAQLSRVEPDGGDPFYDVYPAYRLWREREVRIGRDRADSLLESADICLIGGEDFPGTPRMTDAEMLARRFPRLIVLQILGYSGEAAQKRPAVDLLVQARTGVAFEQFSKRPIAASFPLASYGAALQGLIGVLTALIERERSGLGQVVTVSLAAGAAMFWGPFWMKAERADAGFIGITPRDVRQLILRCAGDEYVQLTLGVPGAVAKVYGVLGITDTVDPLDRGMPDHARGPANFYGNFDLLNSFAKNFSRAELLTALRQAGVPAEAVLPPGDSWSDEQTRVNGIIATNEAGCSVVGSPLRITPADAPPVAQPRSTSHTVDLSSTPGAPNSSGVSNSSGAPLAGVRVIDFGIFVAGPYASKLLANYGADVIQVEPPSGRATLSGERTIISANHGKRTLGLDAKAADGRPIVEMLCKEAHIVMHNFRPGVSDRLGLDQKSLRAINPGLVTLETTAYGATGPKAGAPGFDMVMQAHCGLEYRAGGTGNPPLCCRAPLVDFATGAVGAVGLLIGLYERIKTGRGVAVETNLLNVGTHMLSELIRSPEGLFEGGRSLNRTQTGFHPAECLYQTADGWIAIAARSNSMAAALAQLLDLQNLGDRSTWGDAEHAEIAARIAERSTPALFADLQALGVWAEICARDAWEHGLGDSLVCTMRDAYYGEVVHCVGPLIRFSRSRTVAAPRLSSEPGQDSRAILAELGVPTERIAELLKAGVVVQRDARRGSGAVLASVS